MTQTSAKPLRRRKSGSAARPSVSVRRAQPTTVRLPIDYLLFAATLALVVLGMWMVFDSSYVKTLDNARLGHDAYFFVKRQAVGLVAGIAAMFVMMRIGYWRLRSIAVPFVLIALLALCAVYVPHVGIRENNADRWVKIAGPMQFQPSELAKIALIIYLAALLSRPDCLVRKLGAGLGPALFVTSIYLILIEREPDLGTAVVLFLAVLTQLFLAGARKRHLAAITLVCVAAVLALGFGFGHRQGRITAFLHPDRDMRGVGYQILHSRRAVGSGGWLGAGLGRGKEKYFLPQANSDFIFATLAEELGFMRTVPVLALLALVGWRGFRIAARTKDRFGSLLAAGIASLISWQALINIAVATGSIPATGVPLPFISFGSSSLMLLLAGVGILLNIGQHPVPPAAQQT